MQLREAEKRAKAQLEQTKQSTKNMQDLEESVRRVQVGPAGRLEEDKAQLMLERDALTRSVETLRKQNSDKSAAADQRIKVLEDESRVLVKRQG